MITRLRLDARLFDFPSPRPKGKRGPNPKVGKRQLTLNQRLEDANTNWTRLVIPNWYGQQQKVMLVASGTALWYKPSFACIPLRWVLLKDPQGSLRPMALQCTNLDLEPIQIISYFIRRWTLEVTFEEVRAHLGVETQRQWSDKAIARTTPALMALFSLITLWADQIHISQPIAPKTFAWYQKSHPTFSDAIASVKIRIWRNQKFLTSYLEDDVHNLNKPWIKHLIHLASMAA